MGQERWDVVLKALGGPLAGRGEFTQRGPVVRIGANPGPGGLKLTGYRGLDGRQAVITAYAGGEVSISPVGSNQVRVAPHQNVKWKDLDPLTAPVYLSRGCAIHLGPVGRGATLQFIRAAKLGIWQEGDLRSDAAEVSSTSTIADSSRSDGAPEAFAVKSPRSLQSKMLPIWFLGCFGMMAMSAAAIMVTFVYVGRADIEELGPKIDGEEYYISVKVDKERLGNLSDNQHKGLDGGFWQFVMYDNDQLARNSDLKLRDSKNWDRNLLDHVKMSAVQHSQAKSFYRRLDDVREDYAYVLAEVRAAGLPDVIAGVPYQESQYKSLAQSYVCAKGYWQFMPEVAKQMEDHYGMDFPVRDCKFSDSPDVRWSPKLLTPPRNVEVNGDYMLDRQCRIPKKNGCRVDARTDLELSTSAAIASFKDAFLDETIRNSGSAVQITLGAHNAGYDDGRFGIKKRTNMLPALKAWSKGKPPERQVNFFGDNILCPDHDHHGPQGAACGGVIHAQTQHYVYTIIAQHMLAACYYAKNYPDVDEFKEYQKFYRNKDGYCNAFKIPESSEILGTK